VEINRHPVKAAILFHRFGPYHYARLAAASRLFPLSAIQGCAQDLTYAWEKVHADGAFPLATLFSEGDACLQPPKSLSNRLERQLQLTGCEAIVIPGWSSRLALMALRWGAMNRRPLVLMSESSHRDVVRYAWKEAVKRRLLAICSAALVGGRSHLDYLVQLGMPPDRIFMGYDVVDNCYFGEKAAELRSRKTENKLSRGLPENYFLASARFVEKKNLQRLLEAYRRYLDLARAKGGDREAEVWHLVLLGDGPLHLTLHSRISKLDLNACVHLPGFKQYPELPIYYSLANAFIHPSTTEQWGLVVNEAMASTLPVIVSNRCGCATELVREGVNGFTFDPYNVEELARLMLKVSNLGSQLLVMGRASQRIIADWGPERFALGLKAAVDKAIEIGPRPLSRFDQLLFRAVAFRRA
jgi:1,2-diacylglycerol 3-alpha-glucosyltransferase